MSLRNRLRVLERMAVLVRPPDELSLVVVVPADDQGRPPGIYFNIDNRVATVVCGPDGPDQEQLRQLRRRLSPYGLEITVEE